MTDAPTQVLPRSCSAKPPVRPSWIACAERARLRPCRGPAART